MRPAFFLIALMLLAPAAPALAQRAREVMPLDRILPEIRRTHPGQFYDADGPSPGADGSQHYHLKWMTPDGRIEWLDADARTGRVLNAAPGRDSFDGPGQRAYPPAPSYPTPDYRGRLRGDDTEARPPDRDQGGYQRGYPGGYSGGGGRDYGARREDNRDNNRDGGRERGRSRGR